VLAFAAAPALGVGNPIEKSLHEDGHESRLESGLAFLKRWLGR